jgi:hypothetical protein
MRLMAKPTDTGNPPSRKTAPKAMRRFLERIQAAPDRGTRGKIRWTREELHERSLIVEKATQSEDLAG